MCGVSGFFQHANVMLLYHAYPQLVGCMLFAELVPAHLAHCMPSMSVCHDTYHMPQCMFVYVYSPTSMLMLHILAQVAEALPLHIHSPRAFSSIPNSMDLFADALLDEVDMHTHAKAHSQCVTVASGLAADSSNAPIMIIDDADDSVMLPANVAPSQGISHDQVAPSQGGSQPMPADLHAKRQAVASCDAPLKKRHCSTANIKLTLVDPGGIIGVTCVFVEKGNTKVPVPIWNQYHATWKKKIFMTPLGSW